MLEDLTEALVYTLEAEPATRLSERLYGPAWRDSLLRREGGGWRAKRLPPPLYASAFLAPLLAGSVAHDGRSTRDGRGSGWWLRDEDSGTWRETNVDTLGDAILAPLNGALREAQSSASASALAVRGVDRTAAPIRYEKESARLESARLAVEVLSALSALVASGSSGRWGGVAAGLRSRLILEDEDLASIVLEWLAEVAPVEGWGEGSRLTPAALWQAYEEDGGGLPRRTFLRALSAALGAPRKSGERFYVLPAL